MHPVRMIDKIEHTDRVIIEINEINKYILIEKSSHNIISVLIIQLLFCVCVCLCNSYKKSLFFCIMFDGLELFMNTWPNKLKISHTT